MAASLFDTDQVESGAELSSCGTYRYRLWRIWDRSLPTVRWIMLNPSTADHAVDDPTIRRVVGLSKIHGFGSIMVLNLFAFRGTDPKALIGNADAVGPENGKTLTLECCEQTVICGWGSNRTAIPRAKQVSKMLQELRAKVLCFGKTSEGHPRHPLYLPNNAKLMEFSFE